MVLGDRDAVVLRIFFPRSLGLLELLVQDAFLVAAGGADDDAGDAEVHEVEGGQHRGFEVFADGDNGGVHALELLAAKGLGIGGIHRDGDGHLVGDLLDAFLDTVDGEDLGPAAGHFEGDAGTVFADSDHHVAHALHGCNLLCAAEAFLEDDKELGNVRKAVVHRNGG